jgi:ribonucleoside-diphosphate reductase alpha chain
MSSVNEIGRNVMQGGSRRSAIYASLNWQHEDIEMFLRAKDWTSLQKFLKEDDFSFPLPLDMSNISINWDTDFADKYIVGEDKDGAFYPTDLGDTPKLWYDSVLKMCSTGEPGHSYNFWENENETLRNACTEFTSEDDSDVCNLGSINFGNIESLEELRDVTNLASKFLVCGSIRGEVPYEKVTRVREKNRKIGLGLMGVHEWLLQRNYKYEVTDELKGWLDVWRSESEHGANEWSDRFFINRPKRYRAIAPAGTIGILASTTTGIEPLYAVAYKRRYLQGGSTWKYQYVIDATAKRIIDQYSISPNEIETSSGLAADPERRIKFQYEIQKYVDMGISSTINLPEWGSDLNNEDTTRTLADTLLKYCHGLRGITTYPNGARGGQPLTEVPYEEAKKHHGIVFEEDEGKCISGVCGL